jgi:Na+-driven multidrug efflux pump
MLRIGFPPSTTNIVFCLVYMILTPYIATQGTEALAALGLGHKVISLSYFLCLSFELAAITMTGESTGARNSAEARYRSWVVVLTSGFVNMLVGISLVAAAKPVCSLFTADPLVLKLAASYLYIVVPSQVLLGIGMSVEGAFAGFGHTTTPMVISVLSSLLRWPGVAWVVKTTPYGVSGIWWVFALSTYLRGLGLLALLIFDRKSTSS